MEVLAEGEGAGDAGLIDAGLFPCGGDAQVGDGVDGGDGDEERGGFRRCPGAGWRVGVWDGGRDGWSWGSN